MSITLGIYDLFSYLIPGMLYLYVINEFIKLLKWPYIDISAVLQSGSSAPGTVTVMLLLVVAYFVGNLFEIIRSILLDKWLYFGAPDRALAKIRRRLAHANIKVEFNYDDWSLFQEGLLVRNDDKLGDAERNKANALMMRNFSFGAFLYAVVQLVSFIQAPGDTYQLALIALGVVVGLLCYQRARRFDEWHYRTIYSQALMYGPSLKAFLENSTPAWNNTKKPTASASKPTKQGKTAPDPRLNDLES
jgi:hypothetical protein